MKESDIGQTLIKYLRGEGWDCYPEAECGVGGRADIVAVQNRIVWVIECKQAMSLALLDQAHRWIGYVHYVSVALPRYKRMAWSAQQSLRDHGIGLLTVEPYNEWQGKRAPVDEKIQARFHRDRGGMAKRYVLDKLHDDMKRYLPGGTAQQGYSTPWRRTMDSAREYIAANPGCTVKELIAGINHHYQTTSSARTSLVHWLEQDETVRVMRDGMIRFYPADASLERQSEQATMTL